MQQQRDHHIRQQKAQREVNFTFDCKTCIQTNGAVMGSPLGPVLSGMFMVEN